MEVALDFEQAVFMLFLFTLQPTCVIASVFAVQYPTSVNRCCWMHHHVLSVTLSAASQMERLCFI